METKAVFVTRDTSPVSDSDEKRDNQQDEDVYADGFKTPPEMSLEKKALPDQEKSIGPLENGNPDIARSEWVPGKQMRDLYTNWQFILVFISLSLGFNASFLGTINSWNGAQVVIPAAMAVDPLNSIIAPVNYTEVASSVNLTKVVSGLNVTKLATGVNMTQIIDSVDQNKAFWSAMDGNLVNLLASVNFTQATQGLDTRLILSGINVPQVASGVQPRVLANGLDVATLVPGLFEQLPRLVTEVKGGLWTYPTLIFCQILSSILFGRLSDYVGRRWIFLCGNLISFVGFIATGRAEGGASIAGLSSLIGIGTGIQILGPWLALAELVPVRHRFTVTGLCISLLAPLLAVHVAIATAFILHTEDTWRWSYYVNAILSIASFIGLFISYHPPTYEQLHNHPTDDPPSKDWLGLIVFTVSIAVLSYALGWGKLIWSWNTPQTISITVISGLALVGFLVYEYNWGHDNAAYPAYLIRDYRHISQIVLASVGTLVWLFAPVAQLLIFLTVTPRFGMKGGWEKLWGAGLVSGFLIGSVAMARPKHLKWHTVLGMTFGMVFLAALRGLVSIDMWRTAMALFFMMGFGHGYMTVVTYVTAPMTARKKDIGLVAGLVSAFRGLTFAAVRALFLTLYINQLEGRIQRAIPAAFKALGPVPESVQSLLDGAAAFQRTGDYSALIDLPISNSLMDAVIVALRSAWHWIVSLALIYFLGILLYSVTTPNIDSYLSDEVFVRLNRGGAFRLPFGKHNARHYRV